MSKKEKPLPKPPHTPFGRNNPFEEDKNKGPLIADQMAMAMSEGKLEEFLRRELPDNEHARKLAEMMMGMTGILPPEDVVNAVKTADVKGLMELLKREQRKRSQGEETITAEEKKISTTSPPNQVSIEKEILDQLMKIATDNNLSLDWVFFRSLKRYVEEYQKTGNL